LKENKKRHQNIGSSVLQSRIHSSNGHGPLTAGVSQRYWQWPWMSPRFVWKLLVMGKNGWSEAIYSSCKWFEERRNI